MVYLSICCVFQRSMASHAYPSSVFHPTVAPFSLLQLFFPFTSCKKSINLPSVIKSSLYPFSLFHLRNYICVPYQVDLVLLGLLELILICKDFLTESPWDLITPAFWSRLSICSKLAHWNMVEKITVPEPSW